MRRWKANNDSSLQRGSLRGSGQRGARMQAGRSGAALPAGGAHSDSALGVQRIRMGAASVAWGTRSDAASDARGAQLVATSDARGTRQVAAPSVRATPSRLLMTLFVAVALACAGFLVSSVTAPQQAYAGTTKAQKTAFNRSVKAIKAYKKKPRDIVVNVRDLHLSYKQICQVYDQVHYDGRYFWVNTFGYPPKTTKTITYHCYLSDKAITKARKKMDKAVRAAKKKAPKRLSRAQRVHKLHDWLIRRSRYNYDNRAGHKYSNPKYKFACGTLVYRHGDCLSYALGMRVLLRSAGFTTTMAYDHRYQGSFHCWVRVKIGGKWYNVDPTWDESYTGKYQWKHGICHLFLLKNDHYMNILHPGFKTTHKHTKASYAKKYNNKNWGHCKK